jgi:hypothetical protein
MPLTMVWTLCRCCLCCLSLSSYDSNQKAKKQLEFNASEKEEWNRQVLAKQREKDRQQQKQPGPIEPSDR